MTFNPHSLLALALLTSFFISSGAHADDERDRKENRVYFSITENASLNNDQVTLVLRAYAQDLNPQTVANSINNQMQSALALLKKDPQIQAETSDYQILPVYDKNQTLVNWRGQQTLTLNTENSPRLLIVMPQIQTHLRYQTMQFSVSSAQRALFLNDLTAKAIKTYQQKAQLIAQSFKKSTYKIIETRIHTPNFPSPYLARGMVANSDNLQNAPAMQSGQSQLSVTIDGTLLLPN